MKQKAATYLDKDKRRIANEIADAMKQAADIARRDPEAAAQKHRQGETLVTIETGG